MQYIDPPQKVDKMSLNFKLFVISLLLLKKVVLRRTKTIQLDLLISLKREKKIFPASYSI